MEHLAFIFTIFFMLLGPIKIIPVMAELTRGADRHFKHSLAVRATLIASVLVLFVAVVGSTLLDNYHISLNALRIAGGLVLLIAALNTIFRKPQADQAKTNATATQLAASPLAIPAIVPPAGVAAILVFTMLAPENPGMWIAIGIGLAVMMVLDFLVMYFIDLVLMAPGLMLVLHVVGATLIFMQVCIGIEIILRALKDLGFVTLRAT
ncbi:MAG TPA: MarC family protein [Gemmataceae bacterium]|nr:MarC family protein [Gemmataceae bacterium]